MLNISRKTYERNGKKILLDNDRIMWLKEKHIEEGLHYKGLREITIKYHSDHRKHRYELVDEPKKQCNRPFIDKKLAIIVTMCFRTTSAQKFRTRLGFKQYDIIVTKEQSVLTRIMNSFEGENMQTQHNVLS